MSPAGVRYHPDEWAHDLDEWWSPLTSLAAKAGCASDDWLTVLGVEEFFEPRLLEQARVLTPWICLAASAVAASAARTWAEATLRPDSGPAAWALATAAFDVAVGLERLRWDGRRLGEGVLRTCELIDLGRRAVSIPPSTSPAARTEPTGLYLAAGWLVHAGGAVEPAAVPASGPPGLTATPEPAFASIAAARAGTDPIAWGTAHLVERLIDGGIDRGPVALRPDDPPAEARANVLLVAGREVAAWAEPATSAGVAARASTARRPRSISPLVLSTPSPIRLPAHRSRSRPAATSKAAVASARAAGSASGCAATSAQRRAADAAAADAARQIHGVSTRACSSSRGSKNSPTPRTLSQSSLAQSALATRPVSGVHHSSRSWAHSSGW